MQDEEFIGYVRKFSDMIYRVAYSYTHSRPDSEDIMQDVLLKLYQASKSFCDDEHIKAWLIRVTVNQAKDVLRSARRVKTDALDESCVRECAEDSSLEEAMASLSEEHRLTVYLHYYEGYGVKEIARLLKITEANVKIRLKRARDKLRAFLTEV